MVGLRDIQSGAAASRLRKPVNILRDGVDAGINDMGIELERRNT